MSDEKEKWSCEYCTYKNYPSALKCTMCRAPREVLLNEDIYSLQDKKSSEAEPIEKLDRQDDSNNLLNSASGASGGGIILGANEWACELCTYINKSRDQRCIQCRKPKNASNDNTQIIDLSTTTNIGANNIHEHLQPLRISSSSPDKGALCRANSPPSDLSSCQQTICDKRQPNTQKWICVKCTYENWPKSTKCIMCATPNFVNLNHNQDVNQDRLLANIFNKNSKNNNLNGSNEILAENERISPNHEKTYLLRNNRNNDVDWKWLRACLGVLEGDPRPVENYLANGGDPARQLTAQDVKLLNRASAFDVGHTLVHLAIKFHREDLLATLLSQIEGSESGVKRVPSYVAPDLAADIRRYFATTIRQRKGNFPCYFVTELPTYALPAEVEGLPIIVQEQLLTELLDKDAQAQLETEPTVAINWSVDITVRLGSRLYALWNRSAGDCLLDSAMQATWGVFDRDNTLRRALADSLHQCSHIFYPRWKEYETFQALLLHFTLDEEQWEEDWASLLSLAGQPGASLEQLHIWVLAHILRRPIIVYGVKFVKSFRGEAIGLARFEGVYLPLLWESTFCSRTPLALGYTRGHFSALVPMEPYTRRIIDDDEDDVINNTSHDITSSLCMKEDNGCQRRPPGTVLCQNRSRIVSDDLQLTFLPLMDRNKKLLPVHFLTHTEIGREEAILREWLDICETEDGILLAQQRLHKKPLLVAQMTEEWLNHYRRLAQMSSAPFLRPIVPIQDYSSDNDTDEE